MRVKKIAYFIMALALVFPVTSVVSEVVPNTETMCINAEEDATDLKYFLFEYDDENLTATLTDYSGQGPTDVVIPSEIDDGTGNTYIVTAIDSDAFSSYGITSVVIPDSVTYIGSCAFQFCTSLTKVNIPSGVTAIEGGVFHYCSSLTEIVIPNGVTYIDGCAFQTCKSLTKVTIPSSVTSIGSHAFEGCDSLEEMYVPSSVTSVSGIPSNTTIYVDSYKDAAYAYAINNDMNVMLISENPDVTATEEVTTTEPSTDTLEEDPYENCIFDVNQDGDVKSNDLLLLKKRLLGLI